MAASYWEKTAELPPGIRQSQHSPGDVGSEGVEEGVPITCWGAEGKQPLKEPSSVRADPF